MRLTLRRSLAKETVKVLRKCACMRSTSPNTVAVFLWEEPSRKKCQCLQKVGLPEKHLAQDCRKMGGLRPTSRKMGQEGEGGRGGREEGDGGRGKGSEFGGMRGGMGKEN